MTPRSSEESAYQSARSSTSARSADAQMKKGIDLTQESDGSNEHSPLLAARTSDDELTLVPPMPTETETSPVRSTFDRASERESQQASKNSWYLFLLTLSMLGLQIGWSVELSNGSPYLLSLGISKSLLAFVWIAGPLSGALVQPYVGIKSDRCRLRYGKRRPFMLGGMFATITSLMILAWTRGIVSALLGLFDVRDDSRGVQVTTIVVAVLMIYVLDFAINVVQAAVRAFIVDNAPSHQQDSANAWASRMAGFGNIIGYLFGFVDLPKYLPWLGDSQFKILCWLASMSMLLTIWISCFAIPERDPSFDPLPAGHATGVIALFRTLYRSVRDLPPQVRRVCQVQFFAWIGWFPFLFYTTTYVGEIYAEHYYAAQPDLTPEEVEYFWREGTRAGTFALFMFAIVTFVASVVLPFVVAKSDVRGTAAMQPHDSGYNDDTFSQTPTPTISAVATAAGYFNQQAPTSAQATLPTNKPTSRRSNFQLHLHALSIPHLTLPRLWLLSHLLFATLTWLTLLVRTTTAATLLVAAIGVPWAVTQWVPFALIAAEIRAHSPPQLRPHNDRDEGDEGEGNAGAGAGIVLGLHNVAIAAPQVIATMASSLIFQAMQKPRGSVGDESMGWVLRFGGVAALGAGWLARGLGEGGGRGR